MNLLFEQFHDEGSRAVASTSLPHCLIEWSDANGSVAIDTTFELLLQDDVETVHHDAFLRIAPGATEHERRSVGRFAIVFGHDIDGLHNPTDLRDGDVPAGAFSLAFDAAPVVSTEPERLPADVTAEPTQFIDIARLDVTLAPAGPVTYPDDDTDRTFRRPSDIRCPRGHANPNTSTNCRICGDPLDSTADRPGPRVSTAVAGLRLPDGRVVPINRTLIVGRDPRAAAARRDDAPHLVTIEAPDTVSRTHVSIQVSGLEVSVTDCGARGRTAVVAVGGEDPVAITAWEPRTVGIGDMIHLGGPTVLTITDADALRIPAALEPTAHPDPTPQRDETR